MAAWNVGDCVVHLPEKAGDAYTRNGHVSAVDVAEQSRSSRKGATGTITIKWLRDEVKKIDIDEVEVFDVADIAKKVKQVAAVVAPPACDGCPVFSNRNSANDWYFTDGCTGNVLRSQSRRMHADWISKRTPLFEGSNKSSPTESDVSLSAELNVSKTRSWALEGED
jgi:hypothetical protein